jgi:hypothetical protein
LIQLCLLSAAITLSAAPVFAGPHALGGLWRGIFIYMAIGVSAGIGCLGSEIRKSTRQYQSNKEIILNNLFVTLIAIIVIGLISIIITGTEHLSEGLTIFSITAILSLISSLLAQLVIQYILRKELLSKYRQFIMGFLCASAFIGLWVWAESPTAAIIAGTTTGLLIKVLYGTKYNKPQLKIFSYLIAGVFGTTAYFSIGGAIFIIVMIAYNGHL